MVYTVMILCSNQSNSNIDFGETSLGGDGGDGYDGGGGDSAGGPEGDNCDREQTGRDLGDVEGGVDSSLGSEGSNT